MPNRRTNTGFTLIELMITVAIVGILAAVAYPSYQNSVRKSWRSNASNCLLELANRMERRYTTASSYVGAIPTSDCTSEGNMPNRYTFTFPTGQPTATTFKLEATPVDPGPQSSDDCGTLSVNQMGRKGAGGAIADCWRR